MLLKKTTTTTHEENIEISLPAFFKEGRSFYMICENGNIIDVNEHLIIIWEAVGSYHANLISKMAITEKCTEDEFMAAYDNALSSFEKSMFPKDLPRIQSTAIPDMKLDYAAWSAYIDKEVANLKKVDTTELDRNLDFLHRSLNPAL